MVAVAGKPSRLALSLGQKGMLVALDDEVQLRPNAIVYVTLKEQRIAFKSRVCKIALNQGNNCLALEFIELNQVQKIKLIELLYADDRAYFSNKNVPFIL